MIKSKTQTLSARDRRKTATRELATACQWVRGQIAAEFRGASWAWLRHDFGQGLAIVPEKSALLVAARLIVDSYARNPLTQRASQAKVRPQSIDRIRRLIALVEAYEVPELQQARRELVDQRGSAAERILATWPGRVQS